MKGYGCYLAALAFAALAASEFPRFPVISAMGAACSIYYAIRAAIRSEHG